MYDWKKTLLKRSATMQEAIEVLNNESLRIVLVEDEDQKLLGTISDGDIRRGLLRSLDLDSSIDSIVN